MRRRHVAGLLATVMLFTFSTNSSALWPAGVYRFDAIKGTILDKETRKPIEGVVVVGHWGLRTNQITSSSYEGPLVVKEAVTDKDGKFTIPSSIATDVHKRGHFDSESYPEIAFFKSGYDFTVYRHSGIEPMTGNPVTYNTLTGDDYLISKWLSDSKAQMNRLKNMFLTFGLINTAGTCADYETVTPLLLTAMRSERDRLANIDGELAAYFAFGYSLKSMERCISNLRNGKKP